jgi:phosphatidylglycerophosphate synthase
MVNPRTLVNSISLSRVAIALVFVLSFQRNISLLYLSIILCGVAWITDLLDGYLARKLQVASIQGRHWDSLGDKAFYVAIIVAFNSQGFLGPLLSWGLLVREVALYITRILFIEKLSKINLIWPLTKWHGYFMYVTLVLGLFRMYAEVKGLPFIISPYMQISASVALLCGLGSMIHFLSL